jgi:hypothetical protein
MSKKPAHHAAAHHETRAQLTTEHERLRVEQGNTQDLDTPESRERMKRMGEIERELAKLDEEGDNGEDDKDT